MTFDEINNLTDYLNGFDPKFTPSIAIMFSLGFFCLYSWLLSLFIHRARHGGTVGLCMRIWESITGLLVIVWNLYNIFILLVHVTKRLVHETVVARVWLFLFLYGFVSLLHHFKTVSWIRFCHNLFRHPIDTLKRLAKKKLANKARLKAELASLEAAEAAEAANAANAAGAAE
ncbi:hypothetical protein OROGR_031552 [Orobanche gracilis]